MKRELPVFQEKVFYSEDENAKTLAACLNRIYCNVNVKGLSIECVAGSCEDLEHIRHCYGIDCASAVLLAAILEKTSTSDPVDDEELAVYLGCSNIEFIRYHERLRDLEKAGIIQTVSGRRGRRCYRVTRELLKAVENDGEFRPVKLSGLTANEFFSRMKTVFREYHGEALDTDRMLEDLDCLIEYNGHLTFCTKVKESPLCSECSDTERRIFLYMCHLYVASGRKGVNVDILTGLTDFMEDGDLLKRRIANGGTVLQRSGLVEFSTEDGFINTESLSLSAKVKEEFFVDVDLAPETVVRNRDLIDAGSICPRDIFLNAREQSMVERLEHLLDADNFGKVQERLVRSGMRKGFNAIFYGAPGTGKTASVFELARRSGRDIFRVDVTKLKSKWVGDSEKAVRSVFRMYKAMCRSAVKAPIMLFNEADAIFSKRIENVEQNADQMNNAIQNIILEEMEDLEGILIATTNLLSNLDPAFERRFIYKVEFRMPEKDSRARIWKSMVPSLSEKDAGTLADRYAFSGGNIENVARKSTVEYILSGNEPTLSEVDNYCQEEILNRNGKCQRIGFQL